MKTASERLFDELLLLCKEQITISGEITADTYQQGVDLINSHSRTIHEESVCATVMATNMRQFIAPKYIDR